MPPKFELPVDPQAESALCQLPAEIRQMILRSLLKAGQVIEPYSKNTISKVHGISYFFGYEHGVYGKKGPVPDRLSSHMLRTCQLLFKECHDILYQENTMKVNLVDGKMSFCDVTMNIPINGDRCSVPLALRQFPNLHIEYRGVSSETNMGIFWATSHIVKDKEVDLHFDGSLLRQNTWSPNTYTADIGPPPEVQYWRCQKLTIHCDVSGFHVPNVSKILNGLVNSATSSEPICHLVTDYLSTRAAIWKLPWRPTVAIQRELMKLRLAALDSDDEEVDRMKKKVSKSALDWYEPRAERSLLKSEDNFENYKKSVEKERESFEAHTATLRRLSGLRLKRGSAKPKGSKKK